VKRYSMIRKSGNRSFEKIMLKQSASGISLFTKKWPALIRRWD
jgi:hypothetical protein